VGKETPFRGEVSISPPFEGEKKRRGKGGHGREGGKTTATKEEEPAQQVGKRSN